VTGVTETNVQSLPDLQSLEDEANAWIVRLEGGDASPEIRAEFEAWRSQSAAHEAAFARLSAFWGEVDTVQGLLDYAESDAALDGLRHDRFIHYTRVARRGALGVIAATLVAFVGLGAYNTTLGPGRPFSGEYQTALGEQKTIGLPDGSKIALNTNSTLVVAYTRGERLLRLEKGEAYFDVAHNKKRPFRVRTANGGVTAVGTAFSVKVEVGKFDVVVTEGRVALNVGGYRNERDAGGESDSELLGEPPLEVSAGHAARIDRRVEAVTHVSQDAISRELDWRDGILSFEGETLEEVIAEIGRYTDLRIEIGDESLKHQKIVAYYKIGGVERVFEALRLMENISVERVDDRHVRLYRAG